MAKSITVDASVALSWVLPGEASIETLALRDRAADEPNPVLLVPPIFWYEIANVLWVAVRRHRLDRTLAGAAIGALLDYGFETWIPDISECMDVAFECGAAVYDASYLQLSRETNSALWTIDRSMSRAAVALGILVEPVTKP